MASGVAVQIGRSAAESGGMDEHELPPAQLARPGAGSGASEVQTYSKSEPDKEI